MESLLTLSIGHYRAVEMMLRLVVALVAGSALLLALSTMCVATRCRFPLILSSVALLMAAWFESGIAKAWQGAFELAGSSYCATGLPLAGEDRVLAWALGVPALLFCFGLIELDRGSMGFRHLCVITLLMALLGPVVFMVTVLGTLYSLRLFGNIALRPTAGTSRCMIIAIRIGLASIAMALVLLLMGRMNLLPLGSNAETILVRGELLRAVSDVLAVSVPALALLTAVLNLPEKDETSRI